MTGQMIKVVKFGGSSLADAAQFQKAGQIIRKEEERRYVVPSAPGKRSPDDTKVTDMLYGCYGAALTDEEDFSEEFDLRLQAIRERYQEILDGLGVGLDLNREFLEIREKFMQKLAVICGFQRRVSQWPDHGGISGVYLC